MGATLKRRDSEGRVVAGVEAGLVVILKCLVRACLYQFSVVFEGSLVRCTSPKLSCTSGSWHQSGNEKRSDGTYGYTAQIRLFRDGVQVYQESKTFDWLQAVKGWTDKLANQLKASR